MLHWIAFERRRVGLNFAFNTRLQDDGKSSDEKDGGKTSAEAPSSDKNGEQHETNGEVDSSKNGAETADKDEETKAAVKRTHAKDDKAKVCFTVCFLVYKIIYICCMRVCRVFALPKQHSW